MYVELCKSFFAEAAHKVPGSSPAAARLHGHSLRIDIIVAGETDDEYGWLIDFGHIVRAFKPLYDRIDHSFVNQIEGMDDPSLEGIARWVRDRLAPQLDCLKDVRVSVVGANRFEVNRLPEDSVLGLPERLQFSFEAAQQLAHLPEGHKCRTLHGHSYRVEVAADDLDGLRMRMPDVYEALDHRCLNDIPGLETATSERLAQWVWNRLSGQVAGLRAVVIQETETARCAYYGG